MNILLCLVPIVAENGYWLIVYLEDACSQLLLHPDNGINAEHQACKQLSLEPFEAGLWQAFF